MQQTLDDVKTKADETEADLKTTEKHVGFLKDKVSEQTSQSVAKDVSSSGYRERVVVFEK